MSSTIRRYRLDGYLYLAPFQGIGNVGTVIEKATGGTDRPVARMFCQPFVQSGQSLLVTVKIVTSL